MASKCPFSAVLISLGIVFSLLCLLVYFTLPSEVKPPKLGHGWWGEGDERQDDVQVHKIGINIPDSLLEDLKQRLSKARLFDSLEGIAWQYGTNANYMRELVKYWRTEFDWRRQETLLNSLPTYNTEIEGLKIHFWHLKPDTNEGQKRVPILLIHGWPGSYFEFYKVIQILNSESLSGDYSYEVVCPAIPGYGFSGAPRKPGFNVIDTARIFIKLMAQLEIKNYFIQGGDFGVAIVMAALDKSHIAGVHQNMLSVPPPHGLWSFLWGYFTLPSEEHQKVFPLMDWLTKLLQESGYYHLQATRPDTVGFGLNDSPTGLAAYIIEKFSVFSGCKTNESCTCLESRFTRDELLTNVMIYWFTNSITSSMRYYKENTAKTQEIIGITVDAPAALADFPHEMMNIPRPWLSDTFLNIVQHNRYPQGGHFAALEQPQILAKDVMEFVRRVATAERASKSEL